jgi:hypothetical protein
MTPLHHLPSRDDEFTLLLERLILLKNKYIESERKSSCINDFNDLMWLIENIHTCSPIPYEKLLCLQHVVNNTPDLDFWARQLNDWINKIKKDPFQQFPPGTMIKVKDPVETDWWECSFFKLFPIIITFTSLISLIIAIIVKLITK